MITYFSPYVNKIILILSTSSSDHVKYRELETSF